LHAIHDILAAGREGGEEREDIVPRYREMDWFAIAPVLAIRYQKQIEGAVKIGVF
jgi:hypothetical protein